MQRKFLKSLVLLLVLNLMIMGLASISMALVIGLLHVGNMLQLLKYEDN